jgi:hypothetical protein
MDSTPMSRPDATVTMMSLWQNDLVGIRAERRVTWSAQSGAVAYSVAP